MICKPCAAEADGTYEGERVCSVCRLPYKVYRDDVPLHKQRVVFHKRLSTMDRTNTVRCPGTKQAPVMSNGHDACTGCDCQHKPVGSLVNG